MSLSSRYFDTADRDLLRQGVTLRLRTGDADHDGWVLVLPDGSARGCARTEIHAEVNGNRRAVPAPLREIVYGLARGAQLRPAVTLSTARVITRVVDAAGEVLVAIDDDKVSSVTSVSANGTGARAAADADAGADAASAASAAELTSWRELDLSLGSGDERLLARIARRLAESGATLAPGRPKIARLFGDEVGARRAGRSRGSRRSARSVGDVVCAYLGEQHEALIAGDVALRRGQNAVHLTRVATRRYRSALRVFADLFDADAAAVLDAELAWYSGLLGAVRDGDVLGKHIAGTLREIPADVDLAPVSARIAAHLAATQERDRRMLARQMRGRRYLDLLATLDAWQQHPPLAETAARPSKAVQTYVDAAEQRFAKRFKLARRADVDAEVLHRARKAGKRLRYTSELAGPVLGKSANRLVKRTTRFQQVLGEYQDCTLAGELVRQLATRAEGTELAFGYGVLYDREHERGQAARERAQALRLR